MDKYKIYEEVTKCLKDLKKEIRIKQLEKMVKNQDDLINTLIDSYIVSEEIHTKIADELRDENSAVWSKNTELEYELEMTRDELVQLKKEGRRI